MSDSSFRGITPVTARSSMVPESVTLTDAAASHYGAVHRKIRLRVVTRHPLPELHFLAPFDPHDPQCFVKLQSFVHAHMLARSQRTGRTVTLPPLFNAEALQFQMDNFEVPFDDPEILRDGDTIEVHLDRSVPATEAAEAEATEEHPGAGDDNDHDAYEHCYDENQDSDASEQYPEDPEERDAILEATRLAALLRAGVHNLIDDDTYDVAAQHKALDDLPRMPNPSSLPPRQAPKPNKSTPSKISRSSTSRTSPALPLPPMPTLLGQGILPAAAVAAFEAKRNQMQALPQSKAQKTVAPASISKPTAASTKRSPTSSSDSSSSSSEDNTGSVGSSSSSSSSSDSDSDSSSASTDSSSASADSDSEAKSDSSDSSEGSSSSDSAPSEIEFQSERCRTVAEEQDTASVDTARLSYPHPPGQGTNRTKRRNQMRRKKLQLARDAENLLQFELAKDRAARRERGEDVASTDAVHQPPLWIEDREPMLQIKGVGLAAASALEAFATALGVGNRLPPGDGSFGLVEPLGGPSQSAPSSISEARKGTKRKRNEERGDAENGDAPAPPQPPPPRIRVENMEPGQAPYGGEIPAGISIRHIDCQTYYDEEVEKLQAEAEGEVASQSPAGGREDDSSQRQRSKDKRKGQYHHVYREEGLGQTEVGQLDYGLPDKQLDEEAPRKKVKVEQDEHISVGSIISGKRDALPLVSAASPAAVAAAADMDGPIEPSLVEIGSYQVHLGSPTRRKQGPIDPAVTWMKILGGPKPSIVIGRHVTAASEVAWSDIRPGMGLLWRDLALDPAKSTPAVMNFVGVVASIGRQDGDGGAAHSVQVDVVGPLENDAQKDWADYDVDKLEWTDETRPAQLWLIY
ncbi:hypothetical protein EX895_001401 [Sporisorium graminicola]|uniref:Uncharacterized protein n=1 Tax=Sporisorium graminicola TaxID=280036 RepID=A0A4U7KZ08_9BASI|nr:hypothetical protein EX895_001401 [Sporisorium graminicola]TKY89616.1 hypothetical protein EX895_001401 [Sporisorium graminicola]